MPDTYTVIIQGKKRKAVGWTPEGDFLVAGGETFKISPLEMAPETLKSLRLRGLSKLTFSGGQWLIDGKGLHSLRPSVLKSLRKEASLTEFSTRLSLPRFIETKEAALKDEGPGELEGFRQKVVGVAWVEEHFNSLGQVADPEKRHAVLIGEQTVRFVQAQIPEAKDFAPVLLSGFRSIGKGEVKSAFKEVGQPHQKSADTRARKRNAWFDPDYALAVITKANGAEEIVPLPPGLRLFIKTIMERGGRVARTSLRKGKSDTYQPEKNFKLPAAEKLVGAGLFGKGKRTKEVYYWAKDWC